MGNLFNAHIFKHRQVGEREEVKLRLFNQDGSPADLGGGDSVYAIGNWSFDRASQIYLPTNTNLDFADMVDPTLVGATIDETDSTKLWLPPGNYLMTIDASWNIQSQHPTYFSVSLFGSWDEGDGNVPDGPMLTLPDGVSQGTKDAWGIADIPFYVQVSASHDSPDLGATVNFQLAKV